MTVEENKAIIRNFVEARNQHDVEAFIAFFPPERRERVRQAFDDKTAAFPDVQITIHELLGEEDKIVLRWSQQGTHLGPSEGIAATGKTVNFTGIDIYTLKDGQITALVREQDNQLLLQQLGAV